MSMSDAYDSPLDFPRRPHRPFAPAHTEGGTPNNQLRRSHMATPASVKGHPIHVILVPLAIGLWVFALVADVAAAVTGNPDWRTVAFYSIGGGVVGALLAAVPGFIDLLSMQDPAVRRIGIR